MENKTYSLKKSSKFKEVSSSGKRIYLSSWVFLLALTSEDKVSYFGITVSRKVGNAVVRNKLKRWVRNFVQSDKWKKNFEGKTIVFVFKPQKEGFYSQLQFKEFTELFNKF